MSEIFTILPKVSTNPSFWRDWSDRCNGYLLKCYGIEPKSSEFNHIDTSPPVPTHSPRRGKFHLGDFRRSSLHIKLWCSQREKMVFFALLILLSVKFRTWKLPLLKHFQFWYLGIWRWVKCAPGPGHPVFTGVAVHILLRSLASDTIYI